MQKEGVHVQILLTLPLVKQTLLPTTHLIDFPICIQTFICPLFPICTNPPRHLDNREISFRLKGENQLMLIFVKVRSFVFGVNNQIILHFYGG